MPRKLVGYFLLSLLSFFFFTAMFHTIANAESTQLVLQQPALADAAVSLPPTPTIYNAPTIPSQSVKQQDIDSLSPTPTVYIGQSTNTQTSLIKQAITTQPTTTPTILPTITLAPTDIPTTTPTPQPTIVTSADLETLFSKYSSTYSVDENEMKKIAGCESGFNSASDTGTYAGMFQFSASTWASTRTVMGQDTNPDLRKNSEEAIKTAAFMLSRGEQNAWPNCH